LDGCRLTQGLRRAAITSAGGHTRPSRRRSRRSQSPRRSLARCCSYRSSCRCCSTMGTRRRRNDAMHVLLFMSVIVPMLHYCGYTSVVKERGKAPITVSSSWAVCQCCGRAAARVMRERGNASLTSSALEVSRLTLLVIEESSSGSQQFRVGVAPRRRECAAFHSWAGAE
jgi:hypothetical protein